MDSVEIAKKSFFNVAHKHSSFHKDELSKSTQVGCFYCCSTFPVSSICGWIDEGQTALCPICGIDSVIGDASGIQMTEGFLNEMRDYWFATDGEKR